jgi:hypothetical protein
MKSINLLLCFLFFIPALAQDHFAGMVTSKRVGILNIGMNPSELANLNSKFELQLFATSFNIANNKVAFKDLVDGKNVEDLIFKGNEAVNFNVDGEFAGPGFAFKLLNWGFAVTSQAHIKANIVDVDSNLGAALANTVINSNGNFTTIDNYGNQRINATAWGEVGFSVARKIFENSKHKINGGITFKLLFPGSYTNVGTGNFHGTITDYSGVLYLSGATANLNVAYSGNLAGNFNNSSDYTKSLFGNINGMATDIGFDYQLKGTGKSYKLKIGASLKNMGSMTFKSDNNYSTNYTLSIPVASTIPFYQGLNLDIFKDSNSVSDIEKNLLATGYLGKDAAPLNTDFKVKLPTVLNLYADIKIVSKLGITLFMQQKMNSNSGNEQITAQNIYSVTPRVSLGFFEAFIPISVNEISGTTSGFGFRLGGFFLGSNSIITALTSDTKQADFYTGFRIGIL